MSSLTRILILAGAAVLVALASVGAILGDGPNGPDARDGVEASTATEPPVADPATSGDTESGDTEPHAPGRPGAEPPASEPRSDRTELHAEQLARREAGDPRALGDVDAPVVMIEWGDFLCGFCARFARDVDPELIRRYVDTGLLRIEWRDLPLQGDDAWTAALAGRAAAEQDAFWDLHERLYADAPSQRRVQMSREGLREVADELGLDVDAFDTALGSPAHADSIAAERDQAQALGVPATPAFLIDARPVMGAQPLEVFVDLIESAAAARGVDLP